MSRVTASRLNLGKPRLPNVYVPFVYAHFKRPVERRHQGRLLYEQNVKTQVSKRTFIIIKLPENAVTTDKRHYMSPGLPTLGKYLRLR